MQNPNFEPIRKLISPTLLYLKKEILKGKKNELNFFLQWIRENGSPLIEDFGEIQLSQNKNRSLVTFIYDSKETKQPVFFIADGFHVSYKIADMEFLDVIPENPTGLLYCSFFVHNETRVTYKLCIGAKPETNKWGLVLKQYLKYYSVDPLNPNKIGKHKSLLEMSDAPINIPKKPKLTVNSGKIKRYIKRSNILNQRYALFVYLPPGYKDTKKTVPLVLFLDGYAYYSKKFISVPTMMDLLIANGDIPPSIVAFILNWPKMRRSNLGCNDQYVDYIIKEIIPFLHKKFRIKKDPIYHTIGGFSLGGVMSCYVGFNCANTFGNIICQSTVFRWSRYFKDEEGLLMRYIRRLKKLPLRFYVDVSILEPLIGVNRKFRNFLKRKKYDYEYRESYGNHSCITWKNTLPFGLKFVLNPPIEKMFPKLTKIKKLKEEPEKKDLDAIIK